MICKLAHIAFLICSALLCFSCRSTADALGPNVLDFGAKADGVTDCTASFQRALDSVKPNGGVVSVPAGRYLFRGHIRIPMAVTLQGSWQSPPANETGTVLMPTEGSGAEDGDAFITLEPNALVKGVVITYPEQPSNAEKPTPYPWTIRGLAQDCQVMDILLIRSYKGIDFGTYPCSRFYINNVYGSVLRRGIYIDGSIDVGRVSNVHFSGWGCAPKLMEWRRNNLEVMTIGRADWVWITNCFNFEAAVGLRLIEGKGGNGREAGSSHYVQMAHSGFDMTSTPIIVETCGVFNVSESIFKGKAIQIRKTNAYPVTFSQCSFSPIVGTTTLVEAAGTGRVSFSQCTFEFWDTIGARKPALRADCSSLSVQNCEFGTDNRPSFMDRGKVKSQIELTTSVRSAVIQGNRFRYGQNIANRSKGDIVIKDNVTDNVDLPIFQTKPAK